MSEQSLLRRRTQEFDMLSRIAQFQLAMGLDEVLKNTLSLLAETVGAERGSFFIFREGDDEAQRYITRRNLAPELSRFFVKRALETGLAGWVYRHKTGTLVHDTRMDTRWVDFAMDDTPPRSVLCVPFLYAGNINGIMTLEHHAPNHFTEMDLNLALTVANQATISVRNAQLYDQVRTHERQVQAVLESTDEPLITINPQGQVIMANPASLVMFDAPAEAVLGQSLDDISDNSFFAEVAAKINDGEQRFEQRDEAGGRDYAIHASSWREAEQERSQQQALGHVIVFNDVTTLKDLTRLKSQMVQMASHDLKNPLGVIQGYAEMLLLDLTPSDPSYAYIYEILRVTERVLNMIRELLDVERIQASAKGEFRAFQSVDLLAEVLHDLQLKIQEKNLTVRQEIAPNLPKLWGEQAQISEVFANLVENAIKYTPDGGSIVIRASADHSQGRFHFSVEDTGFGIDENLQEGIFQHFYRAKQPGTEHIPGTGLGLSLVKTVIERHGGETWFVSKAGVGSTFGFWMPLADHPPQARTADP